MCVAACVVVYVAAWVAVSVSECFRMLLCMHPDELVAVCCSMCCSVRCSVCCSVFCSQCFRVFQNVDVYAPR